MQDPLPVVNVPPQINNTELFPAPMSMKLIVDAYDILQVKLLGLRKDINLKSAEQQDTTNLVQLSLQTEDQQRAEISQFEEQSSSFFQAFIASDKTFIRFGKNYLKKHDNLESILQRLGIQNGLTVHRVGAQSELAFHKNERQPLSYEFKISNPDYQRQRVREIIPTPIDEEQVQQQTKIIKSWVTVPDVVTDYKTIYVTKNSLTIRFTKPDDNGSPIDQYKLCLVEHDNDVVQPKNKLIRFIEVKDQSKEVYQFEMKFANVKDVDFGNQLFPFDKMLYIVVLAHNQIGWSINVANHRAPLCLQHFTSTTLYLKGSRRNGLFNEQYFQTNLLTYQDEQQLQESEEQTDLLTTCQTQFIPCMVELGQVRDVSVNHSLLLLNEESNLCQWGKILVFEDDTVSKEKIEEDDWSNVSPYNVGLMEPVYKIACGSYHCICITVDGQLYGWGLNNKGQLGIGSIQSTTEPVLLSYFKDNNFFIDDVRAGNCATICKSKNGQLFAWGERQFQNFGEKQAQQIKNHYGDVINYQCIDPQFFIHTPKLISGLLVSQIAAGFYHFGALSVEGQLYVWGDNDSFCLGMKEYCDQQIVNLISPVQLDLGLQEGSKITEIAFGAHHCLVKVRKGKFDIVLSWGCNDMGQCGQGVVSDIRQIGEVKGLPQQQIIQIDAGTNHSLFLTNDKLYGCGGNECFQLDNKQTTVFLQALEIECLPNIIKIQAGHMVSALLVK